MSDSLVTYKTNGFLPSHVKCFNLTCSAESKSFYVTGKFMKFMSASCRKKCFKLILAAYCLFSSQFRKRLFGADLWIWFWLLVSSILFYCACSELL